MNTFKTIIFLISLIAASALIEASSVKALKKKMLLKKINKTYLKGDGNPYEEAVNGLHWILDNIDEFAAHVFEEVDSDGSGLISPEEGEKALIFACKDTFLPKEQCEEHLVTVALKYATDEGLDIEGFEELTEEIIEDSLEFIYEMGEEEYNIRVAIHGLKKLVNDEEALGYIAAGAFQGVDTDGNGEIDAAELEEALKFLSKDKQDGEKVLNELHAHGILDDGVVDQEEFYGIMEHFFHGLINELEGYLDGPEQGPADGTQGPADGTQGPADGTQGPADGTQGPVSFMKIQKIRKIRNMNRMKKIRKN